MLKLRSIEDSLNPGVSPDSFVADSSHASVAMILADRCAELEVCFIRRAELKRDPWSGQVAFPGGRAEPGDQDACQTAVRETAEEIGLDLTSQRLIGSLPVQRVDREGARPMMLSPFVYHIGALEPHLSSITTSDEVASVFWVPMNLLLRDRNLTTLEYQYRGTTHEFPGLSFEDHVIWGLTLRILDTFAETVGAEPVGSNFRRTG